MHSTTTPPAGQRPKRRTRVWFEDGVLRTDNPQAFAGQFFLPETPPTDDGRIVVSSPVDALLRRKPR